MTGALNSAACVVACSLPVSGAGVPTGSAVTAAAPPTEIGMPGR